MRKNINRMPSGGSAQPEIVIGSRWADTGGDKITIIHQIGNRVTYIRDGFPRECFCSADRLCREFKPCMEASS